MGLTQSVSPQSQANGVPAGTTERVEKFFGRQAFGFGADVFPCLNRREARAMRLASKRLNVAVDRRAWPIQVHLNFLHVHDEFAILLNDSIVLV
jgi:hypothetical protein